jgi:hypothetical protein
MVKLPGDVLDEHIRAYAEDRVADPFVPENLSWLEGASSAQLPDSPECFGKGVSAEKGSSPQMPMYAI